MVKDIELSIVVPAYNEEKYIGRLLESIKKQEGVNFEVIVADNNSKDKTREIVKKFGYKVVKGGMPAKARNNGARAAKGKYILFVDADSILTEGFVLKLVSKMKRKKLGIISGFFKSDSHKISHKIYYFLGASYMYISSFFNPCGGGFYICVSKKIHDNIKGFDEKLKISEDHDYIQRASKFGKFSFLLNPTIISSSRRVDKEGVIGLTLKYIFSEFNRSIGRKPYKHWFKYEFGNFNDKKDKKL